MKNVTNVTFAKFVSKYDEAFYELNGLVRIAGLPWGWHFNPHTHPIPTGIPIGIPMGIPIPTEPEVSTLLHVGLPSPIGRFLLFVR